MKYLKIVKETISDGQGLRLSIYFSGCRHRCPSCHNQESWNCENGREFTEEVLAQVIKFYRSNPLLSGITLTGGDPLFNFKDLTWVLQEFKDKLNCNIWVYTGYNYEAIREESFLKYIDVLIDGRYREDLYSPSLLYRGSSNQRIIDVQESLSLGSIQSMVD